jgi:hypothetical protein
MLLLRRRRRRRRLLLLLRLLVLLLLLLLLLLMMMLLLLLLRRRGFLRNRRMSHRVCLRRVVVAEVQRYDDAWTHSIRMQPRARRLRKRASNALPSERARTQEDGAFDR